MTSTGKKKPAIRRRLPRTAVVGLTIVPGGDATAATVTDVFRRVQAEVPDVRARLGIKAIRPKRAATGDLLLEIPGAEAPRKADDLAALLREHIEEGEGVRITRPVRRVDLRISELEDTISPADIARAVSEFGAGFCADDIRVGRIRRGRDGLGTAWVQAPAVVGVPAAEAKKIRIGWTDARVTLLKGRPIRCFRCLAPGHVQRRCPRDRSRCCYNCGGEGHFAVTCCARPHCVECAEKGREASHRMGTPGVCPMVKPLWQPIPLPAHATNAGSGGTDERRTGGVVVDTGGDPPADTMVVPRRTGEGDASQGSSPLSPPAKKARAAAVPLTSREEEPKPQRQPRAGPSHRMESPSGDMMDVARDSDGGAVDLEHLGASTLSSE